MKGTEARGRAGVARRMGRWLPIAGGLVIAVRLAPQWPKDQTVHYILGDAAARVLEIDARWTPATGALATDGNEGPGTGERGRDERGHDEPERDQWSREALFRFAEGAAPRVVTHQPRLTDGEYTVEIELVVSPPSPAVAPARAIVRRRVTLNGGVTSIELARAVPR